MSSATKLGVTPLCSESIVEAVYQIRISKAGGDAHAGQSDLLQRGFRDQLFYTKKVLLTGFSCVSLTSLEHIYIYIFFERHFSASWLNLK